MIIPFIMGASQQKSVLASTPDYFEMIVKTDNSGTSNNNQFTIPTGDGTFNYEVETSEQNLTGVTGDVTLEWTTPGTYYVRITGQFPQIYFNNVGDKDKLLDISNWGVIQWESFNRSFFGCSNLNITAMDAPDLRSVTSMNTAFSGAINFNSDIGHWDVSNIIDMTFMLSNTNFNQDISSWDVSNVETMTFMFAHSIESPFNQDLSSWCVESFSEEPAGFSLNATSWVLPKPNWGDPC